MFFNKKNKSSNDYNVTIFPKKLNEYLKEIYYNEELNSAFSECDIDVYSQEWIEEFNKKKNWVYDLMGPCESNYDIKAFAKSGTGGVWVLLNDKMVGFIGTEGECGIISRNIDEFMNYVATFKFSYPDATDEDDFIKLFNKNNAEFNHCEVLDKFIKKHKFQTNPKQIYEMLKLGITVKPFFILKSTDDRNIESYSLIGSDDGQESLERFINKHM